MVDAAAHARMAAYAAMVYNANRPPGYPAIAVVPDHAAGLAEEINAVVSGRQVRTSIGFRVLVSVVQAQQLAAGAEEVSTVVSGRQVRTVALLRGFCI